MEALLIIFTALFADNLLFTRLFGVESFFTAHQSLSKTAAYGGTVTLVSVLSGAVSLALYHFVFTPLKIKFVAVYVSVLVICAVICAVKFIAHRLHGRFEELLSESIPMITTNCVVLGSIMLCIEHDISYVASLLCLLFAGVGFTVAVLVLGSIRERLEESEPLAAFRGLPILLLSASFAAMAFAGFFGLRF